MVDFGQRGQYFRVNVLPILSSGLYLGSEVSAVLHSAECFGRRRQT